VTHVLPVSAPELRDPVTVLVLVKAFDRAIHVRLSLHDARPPRIAARRGAGSRPGR
jgi:hypothetical protein